MAWPKGRPVSREIIEKRAATVKARRPLELRFWSKVDKNGPVPEHRPELGPCFMWIGSKNRRLEFAHRVAFLLAHGRWPEPNALHKCDNPSCVRAEHLFEGTQAANMADMFAKGRGARAGARGDANAARKYPERLKRGESASWSKLTNAAVIEMRQADARGESRKSLAARFSVSEVMVSLIVRRLAWKHVGAHPEEGAR
jgi:hypothetical protein